MVGSANKNWRPPPWQAPSKQEIFMENIDRIRRALWKAFTVVFVVSAAFVSIVGWCALAIFIFQLSIIGGCTYLFVTAVFGMSFFYYFK